MKKLPLVSGYANAKLKYKENSVEFIEYCNKTKPDIIELDLRKSKDQILFCYHGSMPFGAISAYEFMFKKFKKAQKKLDVVTFEKLISKINYKPILYLDMKQFNIWPKDIEKIVSKYKFKDVCVAGYSKRYLRIFRKRAKVKYKYVYQNLIFNITRVIKKYKGIIDVLKIGRWSINRIEDVRNAGFDVQIAKWFYSPEERTIECIKRRSFYIYSKDKDTHELREMIQEVKGN